MFVGGAQAELRGASAPRLGMSGQSGPCASSNKAIATKAMHLRQKHLTTTYDENGSDLSQAAQYLQIDPRMIAI